MFREVKIELSKRNLFNFYFNYSLLERYLKLILNEESDIVNNLSKSLEYTAFNINFSNEQLNLEGYTNINDSIPSYLKALRNVKPGKMRAHEIITDQAAIYISMCFNDFGGFQQNLINEFSSVNAENYEDYSKTITKMERRLKINLEKDFFSWIGNEIAFVKPRPSAYAREQDVIVTFHTKDIEDAKKGMNNLTKQIQKKLPIRFEAEEYLNYEINYLNISGFFKLFFGKLFGRLEKPYFTFIDDFVVFSNSPTILKNFIDDYIKGKTLSHKKAFLDFMNDFNTKSNATIFIQTPKFYSHLLYYGKNEKKKDIKENKDVIISFARIGFQFTSDGKMFKTTLKAQFDENALMDEEMEKFEAVAGELYNKEYETLSFKINLAGEELTEYGPFTIYYEDSTIKAEGKINNEAINGLVRSYYPGGNIMNAINYDDGIVNGVALFYYDNDNQSIKSEVRFVQEVIVGEYREFYENGARKSFLNYKDGKANGDAEFYYSSGVIKMTGKYKGGLKRGKWKHYTETGQQLDKEKWKAGEKK